MSFAIALVGISHGAATDVAETGWIDESFELTAGVGTPGVSDILALMGAFGRVIGTVAYWLINTVGGRVLIFVIFLGIIGFIYRKITAAVQARKGGM